MLKRNRTLILAILSLNLTLACTEKSTPPNPGTPASDFPNNNILRIDGVNPEEGDTPFSYRYRVRYEGPQTVLQPFVQACEQGKFVLKDGGGAKIYKDGPGQPSLDLGTLNLYIPGFYKTGKQLDLPLHVVFSKPKSTSKPWTWVLTGQSNILKVTEDGSFPIDSSELTALEGKPEWLDYCTISGDDANNVILGAVLFGADPKLKNKDFLDRIHGAKKAYLFGVRLTKKKD